LDLAYAYNLTKDRDIASPRNPVNGSYEFDAHLFGVTYGYSF
jgi:long-subunit fatty acid transport protein